MNGKDSKATEASPVLEAYRNLVTYAATGTHVRADPFSGDDPVSSGRGYVFERVVPIPGYIGKQRINGNFTLRLMVTDRPGREPSLLISSKLVWQTIAGTHISFAQYDLTRSAVANQLTADYYSQPEGPARQTAYRPIWRQQLPFDGDLQASGSQAVRQLNYHREVIIDLVQKSEPNMAVMLSFENTGVVDPHEPIALLTWIRMQPEANGRV